MDRDTQFHWWSCWRNKHTLIYESLQSLHTVLNFPFLLLTCSGLNTQFTNVILTQRFTQSFLWRKTKDKKASATTGTWIGFQFGRFRAACVKVCEDSVSFLALNIVCVWWCRMHDCHNSDSGNDSSRCVIGALFEPCLCLRKLMSRFTQNKPLTDTIWIPSENFQVVLVV